jgi:hypothetical protein
MCPTCARGTSNRTHAWTPSVVARTRVATGEQERQADVSVAAWNVGLRAQTIAASDGVDQTRVSGGHRECEQPLMSPRAVTNEQDVA